MNKIIVTWCLIPFLNSTVGALIMRWYGRLNIELALVLCMPLSPAASFRKLYRIGMFTWSPRKNKVRWFIKKLKFRNCFKKIIFYYYVRFIIMWKMKLSLRFSLKFYTNEKLVIFFMSIKCFCLRNNLIILNYNF